jgi:probable phosphomutase (TIGR03848 family)
MKRLLLLRHASTEQTGRRLSGWTPGIHLSEQGVREAQALAERLAPLEIQAVYSSPLERCLETAAAVAEPRGLEVETVEDVGEVRYGEWTGRELSELAKQELWRLVQLHPSGARFPGGESILEMQTRAVVACERLRSDHSGETVAVCSHADVIKAVTAHYLGMHLDLFQRLVVGPASVTALGFGPLPHLLRLNSIGDERDLRPLKEPEERPKEPEEQPGEPGEGEEPEEGGDGTA